VPKFDIVFALFPAKKNFFAADIGGKIDQAAIEIFELDFAILESHEDFFNAGERFDVAVDAVTAKVFAGGHGFGEVLFAIVEGAAEFIEFSQPLPDLRQELPGFFAGVMFFKDGHPFPSVASRSVNQVPVNFVDVHFSASKIVVLLKFETFIREIKGEFRGAGRIIRIVGGKMEAFRGFFNSEKENGVVDGVSGKIGDVN